jgi:hypothetical protein
MRSRVLHAFRIAAFPSFGVLILAALITVRARSSPFHGDLIRDVAIGGGLVLVVFLTYFVLALAGFKASPQGVVDVPRPYAWLLVSAIVVLVFGVLFYMLLHRSR